MSLSTNDTQALRGDLRCCMHSNNMGAMVDLYEFITACTAILLNKCDKYQLSEEKYAIAKSDLDHEFEQRIGQ